MMIADPTPKGSWDAFGNYNPGGDTGGGGETLPDRPAPPRPRPPAPPPAPRPPAPPPAPPPTYPRDVPKYKPQPWVPPVTDLDIVNEIADCLNKPPSDVNQDYILRAMHIAEYLHVPASNTTVATLASNTTDLERLFVVKPVATMQLSLTNPVTWVANEAGRSVAFQSVANVLALISRIDDFAARSANAGYIPPDNPFTAIAALNASRNGLFTRIIIPDASASDLIYSVKTLVNLLDAENQGGIDMTKGTINSAQLSHVRLSFDGFGGSGNPGADILRFLPNADEIKRETERQALSVLDFSKRIPYILFTMEYAPVHGSPSAGTLIGWKRIPDASGYVIKRRGVFSQEDIHFTVDNNMINEQSNIFRDYVKTYATTFFNSIDENSVMTFLDVNPTSDEYFVYTVQAYQVRSEQKAATFTIESTPVSLTPVAKSSIIGIINTLDPTNAAGDETISPWPAFAQHIYGDSTYDWILAAVNTRASISRGDLRSTTRNYSYLNAHAKFLLDQSDAGKLVKPVDPNAVVKNVNDSIQKFGVSQTIQNLFDETGISYYFEGRDAREDTHFDRAGTESVETSQLFNIIGSAIDPDTAMIDLKTLATNMSQLLSQQLLGVTTQLQPGEMGSANSKPTEITVPEPNEMTAAQADGPFQFISKIGDLRDPFVDLTTFDGISKLMRVIRILSDFGPNRVLPRPPPPEVPPVTVDPEFEIDKGITRPPIVPLPTPVIPPKPVFWSGYVGMASAGSTKVPARPPAPKPKSGGSSSGVIIMRTL